MKLVIMQDERLDKPGNASWIVWKPDQETPDQAWEMQGHKVIEVTEEEGKRIIEAARISLQLQLELRARFYGDPWP